MTDTKTYHVDVRDDASWEVKAEQNTRATSLHDNKEDAVLKAQELASNQRPGEVVVHHDADPLQESVYFFDDEVPS